MRIRHGEIAELARDPIRWAATRSGGGGPRRMSYARALILAIQKFHKTDSADAARRHLDGLIARAALKNSLRIDDALSSLDAYLEWCRGSGLVVADAGARLGLSIGPFIVSGQINRVDVVSNGLRGVLLGTAAPEWQEELRMPIIQRGLAELYGRALEELVVGVQRPDGSDLAEAQYSRSEVDQASASLENLVKLAASPPPS